ncbi:hypothetical protein APR41_13600 [Salegentibacter salinarum]|uniref:Uncharacterized protein n=1 Tax=Salegentibacter salinarum TaxID=447422 RepID=A0A2N0U121_9FLAO|nr:hypothetical protein [Salegentibacter salinarum]PKD20702.1 hypothetical protein APR41_13600 [Salegentibacter salinarum]SKB82174.1 hypothetical protein SAMN05660903_02714 [Salegentibacter salinarum]
MRRKGKFRAKWVLIPVTILLLVTAIVMWLWNAILPEVLEVKTITYWQAMGILVLSKILFGGFGGCKKGNYTQRKNLREKFKSMSPEEREKFRKMWKQKCKKDSFD